MKKIKNEKYANRYVAFETVGAIKADENGIFEIPDDAVANDVVKNLSGFSLVVEKAKKVDPTPSISQKTIKVTEPVKTDVEPEKVSAENSETTPEK